MGILEYFLMASLGFVKGRGKASDENERKSCSQLGPLSHWVPFTLVQMADDFFPWSRIILDYLWGMQAYRKLTTQSHLFCMGGDTTLQLLCSWADCSTQILARFKLACLVFPGAIKESFMQAAKPFWGTQQTLGHLVPPTSVQQELSPAGSIQWI